MNQLLGDVRVNVDIKNNEMDTALCLASKLLTTFPLDSFKMIVKKSTDVNAQDKDGNTPLHIAYLRQSEFGVKELLKNKKVSVDVENNLNQTVYRFPSDYWPDIPDYLCMVISRRSVDDHSVAVILIFIFFLIVFCICCLFFGNK